MYGYILKSRAGTMLLKTQKIYTSKKQARKAMVEARNRILDGQGMPRTQITMYLRKTKYCSDGYHPESLGDSESTTCK